MLEIGFLSRKFPRRMQLPFLLVDFIYIHYLITVFVILRSFGSSNSSISTHTLLQIGPGS